MYKFKISSFLILIIFFLNNCGFTPQYAGFKGIDFSLNINKIEGDRELNNAIKSQLDRYNNNKIQRIEILNVNIKVKIKFYIDAIDKLCYIASFDCFSLHSIFINLLSGKYQTTDTQF